MRRRKSGRRPYRGHQGLHEFTADQLWLAYKRLQTFRRDAVFNGKVIVGPHHKLAKYLADLASPLRILGNFPLRPAELRSVETACERWLGCDGLFAVLAAGCSIKASGFIAAKAYALECLLTDQYYAASVGAMRYFSKARTVDELFALLWQTHLPASGGWNGDLQHWLVELERAYRPA